MSKRTYYGICSCDKGWLRYALRDNRECRRFYVKHRRAGNIISVGRRIGEFYSGIGWTLNHDNNHLYEHGRTAPIWAREIVDGGNF